MNLCFLLSKENVCWFFFPLYNDKDMSVLIEDETASSAEVFLYHIFHFTTILAD